MGRHAELQAGRAASDPFEMAFSFRKTAAQHDVASASKDCWRDIDLGKVSTSVPRKGKLHEQRRFKVREETEFFKMAAVFGVHDDGGINPHWNLFRQPASIRQSQKYESLKENVVFIAMYTAVMEAEADIAQWRVRQHRQILGGSWRQVCAGIRQAALRILTRKRRRKKQRQ